MVAFRGPEVLTASLPFPSSPPARIGFYDRSGMRPGAPDHRDQHTGLDTPDTITARAGNSGENLEPEYQRQMVFNRHTEATWHHYRPAS